MAAHTKHQRNNIFSFVAILFLPGINTPVWAQNEVLSTEQKQEVSDTSIYRAVTKHARQIGNWNDYLAKSLKVPKQFKRDKISVSIILEFIVEKDGRLSHPKAVRSTGSINGEAASQDQLLPFIEEAFRVVIHSPKWMPATNDAITVRSYFTVPIQFKNN